jgi:hypothetical protein
MGRLTHSILGSLAAELHLVPSEKNARAALVAGSRPSRLVANVMLPAGHSSRQRIALNDLSRFSDEAAASDGRLRLAFVGSIISNCGISAHNRRVYRLRPTAGLQREEDRGYCGIIEPIRCNFAAKKRGQ